MTMIALHHRIKPLGEWFTGFAQYWKYKCECPLLKEYAVHVMNARLCEWLCYCLKD